MAAESSGHRQGRSFINVVDEACLGDLAADQRPGRGRERLAVERDDAGWRREAFEERQEPVGPAVPGEVGDLGKVERQVVGEDPMPSLRLGLRDGLVGFGQLLQVIDSRRQRIDIALRRSNPQHVQNDLSVLWVVLVPAIM